MNVTVTDIDRDHTDRDHTDPHCDIFKLYSLIALGIKETSSDLLERCTKPMRNIRRIWRMRKEG
jgi:hypothetical protein